MNKDRGFFIGMAITMFIFMESYFDMHGASWGVIPFAIGGVIAMTIAYNRREE